MKFELAGETHKRLELGCIDSSPASDGNIWLFLDAQGTAKDRGEEEEIGNRDYMQCEFRLELSIEQIEAQLSAFFENSVDYEDKERNFALVEKLSQLYGRVLRGLVQTCAEAEQMEMR
jgi:hypothetical protein